MHIRKISIGSDYKTSSMHYLIGQDVLGGSYSIHLIQFDDNKSTYKIWIESDGEILLWKEIGQSVPVVIEYNINF
jgi:hypothetical protein